MCGIFVAFNFTDISHLEARKFKKATLLANHRGPDNFGYFKTKNCYLGHTRLSIIGLEKDSNQPFKYKQFVISYNGEIFNYIELKNELINLGYKFITNSDTEVVLISYFHWGTKCFEKFNGMWAIVILDTNLNKLIISRDRFGQKPLFLAKKDGTYFVASECNQLLQFIDPRPNFELISYFLKEGTYEGNRNTFFLGIEEFPKASFIILENEKSLKAQPYWSYSSKRIKKTSEKDFAKFTDLLEDSIRIRLRSDVSVGLLLSGGVDSTIVADFCSKLNKSQKLPSFVYSSEDKDDETEFAKKVSKILNYDIHISKQTKSPKNYIKRLSDIVKNLGRGHSSPAIVSIDYLYESIKKQKIKVVLDGQGADELLAGYKTYHILLSFWYLRKLKISELIYNLKDQLKFGFIISIILYLRCTLAPKYRKLMRLLYGYEKFFSSEKFRLEKLTIPQGSKKHEYKNSNILNSHLIWQHNLGLENLLYYGDIIAMKNSVENRSPFMDHRLVEFAYSHDEKLKVFNGLNKFALRKTPSFLKFKEIIDREKIGFSSPISIRTKKIMNKDLLTSDILNWPIFSNNIRSLIQGNSLVSEKYERFLFRIYQVHLWNKIFIKSGRN
jgi:asparagine synthase (glutamine-hydrolysing)